MGISISLHLGGFVGNSFQQIGQLDLVLLARLGTVWMGFKHLPSGNVIVILKMPPSQMVFSLPGIPHSHILRSRTPCAFLTGRAQKPNGWSFRHCFLYEGRENKILVSHLLYVSHDRNSNVPLLGKARLGQRHDGRDVLCAEDMR